jgi:hypothetical protein
MQLSNLQAQAVRRLLPQPLPMLQGWRAHMKISKRSWHYRLMLWIVENDPQEIDDIANFSTRKYWFYLFWVAFGLVVIVVPYFVCLPFWLLWKRIKQIGASKIDVVD